MTSGCEYGAYCSFCGESGKSSVCGDCRKTAYPAGGMILYEDMVGRPMVLLSGALGSFGAARDVLDDNCDSSVVRFILTRGAFINNDVLWTNEIRPGFELSGIICLTDCTIARIDKAAARRAFEESPETARAVMQSIAGSWLDAVLLASAFRNHGVYEGVRDLLLFLSGKGVVLTHQQISMISNHNRPSVTKAIGELRLKEPDVWRRVAHVVNRA